MGKGCRHGCYGGNEKEKEMRGWGGFEWGRRGDLRGYCCVEMRDNLWGLFYNFVNYFVKKNNKSWGELNVPKMNSKLYHSSQQKHFVWLLSI